MPLAGIPDLAADIPEESWSYWICDDTPGGALMAAISG